jgi:hypothetical protein
VPPLARARYRSRRMTDAVVADVVERRTDGIGEADHTADGLVHMVVSLAVIVLDPTAFGRKPGSPSGPDVGAAGSPAGCSGDVGCRGDGSLELVPMVETSLAGAATEVVPLGEVEIGRDRPGE